MTSSNWSAPWLRCRSILVLWQERDAATGVALHKQGCNAVHVGKDAAGGKSQVAAMRTGDRSGGLDPSGSYLHVRQGDLCCIGDRLSACM